MEQPGLAQKLLTFLHTGSSRVPNFSRKRLYFKGSGMPTKSLMKLMVEGSFCAYPFFFGTQWPFLGDVSGSKVVTLQELIRS